MKVQFKKLNRQVELPKKAHDSDACFDLVAISERIDLENRYLEYGTGFALDIPKGYCAKIYPRSSISNKDLVLSNSCGIVDAGYAGEILIRFKSLMPMGARKYKVGERVAQLKIEKVEDVEFIEVVEFEATERGASGFGSSGS